MSEKTKATDIFLKFSSTLWSFAKKHVRAFYIVICLVLALLTVSLVSFNVGRERRVLQAFDSELQSLESFGYSTTVQENGNVTYTPINGDPQLYFTLGTQQAFNCIKLNFEKPIATSGTVQIYYSYSGEALSEPCSVKSFISPDGMSVELTLPKEATYTMLRIDINTEFTLDTVDLVTTEYLGITRSASVGAIIALAVILVLLVAVEGYFGFYKWAWSLVKSCYGSAKSLLVSKKYASFAVRVLLIFFLLALCVSYAIVIAFAISSLGFILYAFILTVLCVALFIADRILSGNISAPIMFLVITVLCGFMMAVVLPAEVSSGWDEEFHYARCIDVKLFYFGNEKTAADSWQEIRGFSLSTDRFLNAPNSFIENLLALDSQSYEANPVLINVYKRCAHIPSAIAMAGADLTSLNYLGTVIIAKMASVLVYAFVIYLGIKRLKSGALIFSSVCLMPTALFLASVFSYDYFVTAFVCYSFAYFISELQSPDKKFTLRDAVLMFGSLIIGCSPKTIYLVLAFPMLFMSKNKFNTKKGYNLYRLACIGTMIIMVFSFILPFITKTASGAVAGDFRGGSGVNSTEQAIFILKNPIEYTKILLKFLGEYVSFSNASVFVGSYAYVGFANTLYGTLAICIMAFCAFTDKGEGDDFKGSTGLKAITLLTCFGTLALVATALYLSFTPVAHTTVNGCQWRYIIPILLPFLYCVGSSKVRHSIDKRFLNGLVFGALSLNMLASFYDVYILKVISLL